MVDVSEGDRVRSYVETMSWQDWEAPVEDRVYELVDPYVMPNPHAEHSSLVFTHVLSHGVDHLDFDGFRFDLLLAEDQPLTPRAFEMRYELPWMRYGIWWPRQVLHRHVKLDRRVDPMQELATALNTSLADAARARKRHKEGTT